MTSRVNIRCSRALTPTRKLRLRKAVDRSLLSGHPVTSLSGAGAQVAIELCEEKNWSYSLYVNAEGGFCVERAKE